MLFIVLTLFAPCFGATFRGDECEMNHAHTFEYFPLEGYSLSSSAYQSFRPVSSATCGQRCHFSPECASFINYCRRTQRCGLNNCTRSASWELVQDEECVYYDANKTTASHVHGPRPTVTTQVVTTPGPCSYNTTPTTPYEYTYVLPHVTWGTTFRVDFLLRAPKSADIALSSLPSDTGIFYEIIVGGYENTKSAIRRCKACESGQRELSTYHILSDAEDRPFWIEYTNVDVRVGKGGAPPLLTQTWGGGQRPTTIHVGVSTWQDASGRWTFPEFCVNN